VRSLRQLQQTELFRPDEYDTLIEVTNQAAFDLCLRLNREESIIAGPSSGMALAGAFDLVPDEPGVLAVVLFPDSAFKYASSVPKYLPKMGSTAAPSPREHMMDVLVENAKGTPGLTIEVGPAHELIETANAVVVDVREPDEYAAVRIPGGLLMPLQEMSEYVDFLPEDREAPVLVVCATGVRSLSGALFLASLGYRDVRSINGGTTAWAEQGFEVARG
jgi:rhodanese-related sulfurtransferase